MPRSMCSASNTERSTARRLPWSKPDVPCRSRERPRTGWKMSNRSGATAWIVDAAQLRRDQYSTRIASFSGTIAGAAARRQGGDSGATSPESDTSQSGNKRGEDYGRSAARIPFKSALSYRNYLRSWVWHSGIPDAIFASLPGVDFCTRQTLYTRPFGSLPLGATACPRSSSLILGDQPSDLSGGRGFGGSPTQERELFGGFRAV